MSLTSLPCPIATKVPIVSSEFSALDINHFLSFFLFMAQVLENRTRDIHEKLSSSGVILSYLSTSASISALQLSQSNYEKNAKLEEIISSLHCAAAKKWLYFAIFRWSALCWLRLVPEIRKHHCLIMTPNVVLLFSCDYCLSAL